VNSEPKENGPTKENRKIYNLVIVNNKQLGKLVCFNAQPKLWAP